MGKHTFTTEETRKALEAAREARKKVPSRRQRMAAFGETFARQRAEYSRHPHKRIGLPLVDQVEKQGSLTAAVKLMCLDCSGWVKPEIRDCVIVECPLFPFRPYQDIGQRNPNDPLPAKPAPDTPAAPQTGVRPEAGPEVV
jgi:hypothetical protein